MQMKGDNAVIDMVELHTSSLRYWVQLREHKSKAAAAVLASIVTAICTVKLMNNSSS